MSGEMMYRKKTKQPLYRELEAQLKKAEENKELHYWSNEPLKTEKGRKLSDKLQGLARLSLDVGAYGKVVSADMLTKEAKQEFKTNYGLSQKELERMLGDMQAGAVGVSEVPDGVQIRKPEYTLFANTKRSAFAKQETEQHKQAFEELGEMLKEKRKKQKLEAYRTAELTKEEMQDFRTKYNLSEKELKKMVLDIQTGAVQLLSYEHMPLEAEKRRMEEEACRKQEEEVGKQQQRAEASAREQQLREEQEKQNIRRRLEEAEKAKKEKEAEDAAKAEMIAQRSRLLNERAGVYGIDVAAMQREEVKALFTLPQKEFEDRAWELADQVSENSAQMEDILKQQISEVNQKRVIGLFVKKYSATLIFGSPMDVMDAAEELLENGLSEEILISEKNVHVTMQRFKNKWLPRKIEDGEIGLSKAKLRVIPTRVWKAHLLKALSPQDSLENMQKKTEAMLAQANKNMEWFHDTYYFAKDENGMSPYFPLQIWYQLYDLRDAYLSSASFQQEIQQKMDEILKPYRTAEGTLKFPHKYLLTMDIYLQAREADRLEKNLPSVRETFGNLQMLTGEEFLQYPEFADVFKSYQLYVRFVLGKLLQKGAFDLPALKDVKKWEDLESVPHMDFRLFMSRLRQNVRPALQLWHNLRCPQVEEVKKALLGALLSGKLNQDNFDSYVEEELKERNLAPLAEKVRIRFMLDCEPRMFRLAPFVEDKENRMIRSRQAYFDKARRVWKLLKDAGMEKRALAGCQQYAEHPYPEDVAERKKKKNPAEPIKELLREIGTGEAKALAEELRRGEEGNFMNEFFLCQREELLLQKTINPMIEKLLAGQQYNYQALVGLEQYIFKWMKNLQDILNQKEVPEAEQAQYQEKMLPVFVGVYGSGYSQEQKKERFGVQSAEEALEQLSLYLDDKAGKYYTSDQEERKMLSVLKERNSWLSNYQDGILRPMLPHLMNDRVFWSAVVGMDQEIFAEKLHSLCEDLQEPLKLLRTQYSHFGKVFYEQICDTFAKDILYGEKKDGIYWRKKFEDFFQKYCSQKYDGFSMNELLLQFRANDPIVPYLTMLLTSNGEGLELLKDKEKFDRTIAACRENVIANEQILENYLRLYLEEREKPFLYAEPVTVFKEGIPLRMVPTKAFQNENAGKVFREGFRMRMLASILYQPANQFSAMLNDQMVVYEGDVQTTAELQVQVEKLMANRRTMLYQIASRQDQAHLAEEEELKEIVKLRTDLHMAGSPLLAALGVKQRPSGKALEKARKKLENFGGLPAAVQDCLLERILSGADEKQLEQEAEWLMQADTLILQRIEGFSEKMRSQIPSVERLEQEALLFLYSRQHKQNQTGTAATAADAALAIQQIRHRHAHMLRLLSTNYVTTMVYHPELQKEAGTPADNPVLAARRQMVMEGLTMGMYTMDAEAFAECVTKQETYFAAAELADQIFVGCIREYLRSTAEDADEEKLTEEQQMAIRRSLMEYFHTELMQGKEKLDTLKLQQETDSLLREEHCRRFLRTGMFMEGANRTTLLDEERALRTTASRETLERFLGKKENEKFLAAYSRLNRVERQLFALAVLQTERSYLLPSAQFVCSQELAESRQQLMDEQVKAYIATGFLQAEIRYDTVMDLLEKANGTVNEAVFKEAMAQTESYIRMHQENFLRDFELLNDTALSMQEAARLRKQDAPNAAGQHQELLQETEEKLLSTPEEMRDWILAQDTEQSMKEKEAEPIAQTKQRLKALNKFQLKLLARALQDRTMLDHSTRIRKGEEAEFVNMEKRQDFKNRLSREPRVYSTTLKQATAVLQSFQLRDDKELFYGDIRKEDFAPHALERKSTLDWTLLSHALDFVEECCK